jgi:LysM repeat protein
MNQPSPLIPQGSLLEQKNKSRARVKVAFFTVVGVHVAAIVIALLAQGCKREPAPAIEPAQPQVPLADTNLPALDTNLPAAGLVASNAAPVPIPEPAPAPVPLPTTQEHVIQKGDTFSSLAAKYHVTVKALQAANPTVNPTKLQINQKIIIPPPAAAPVAAPGGTAPAAGNGERIYVVKAGDSLTKIATEHHTTVSALRKLNNLTTDRIKVGDKLKLPAAATPPPAASEPAPAPAPTPNPAPAPR